MTVIDKVQKPLIEKKPLNRPKMIPLYLTEAEHRRLRIACVVEGKTMNAVIRELVEQWLGSKRV